LELERVKAVPCWAGSAGVVTCEEVGAAVYTVWVRGRGVCRVLL